jgi:hypothetical protein
MINKECQVDEALFALFADIDITPGFDAAVLARLHDDSRSGFAERADSARQRERERYRIAQSELEKLLRSSLRILALDGLGIGYLLAISAVAVWRHGDSRIIAIISDYYPYIAVLLGILIALIPLVGAKDPGVSVSGDVA